MNAPPQLYSHQKQLDERDAEMNAMKRERQKLLGLIRSLESDIEDLKRQISGHERTNQDKVTGSDIQRVVGLLLCNV